MKAIKQMTRALRLELAQYYELVGFSQFGTELDVASQKRIKRGEIVYQLLKQKKYATYSFVDQALMLFLFQENFLDDIPLAEVSSFTAQYISYVRSVYSDLYEDIFRTADVSVQQRVTLKTIAEEFNRLFVPNLCETP